MRSIEVANKQQHLLERPCINGRGRESRAILLGGGPDNGNHNGCAGGDYRRGWGMEVEVLEDTWGHHIIMESRDMGTRNAWGPLGGRDRLPKRDRSDYDEDKMEVVKRSRIDMPLQST